jgi:hypothetical protein
MSADQTPNTLLISTIVAFKADSRCLAAAHMANNIILEKTDSRGEFNLPPATSSPSPEDSEYHYREESPPVPAATYALSTTPAFRETVRQLSRSTDTMRVCDCSLLYISNC